jgi:uncharacterized membrane protein
MGAVSSDEERPATSGRAASHLRAVIGALILLCLLWLLPAPAAQSPAQGVTLEHGRVVAVLAPDPETGLAEATVLILDGERAGEQVRAAMAVPGMGLSPDEPAPFVTGDEVVLQVSSTPEGEFVAITDRWRAPLLLAVIGLFAVLVVVVAGWRGVRALVALALTVGVVTRILLPLLVAGWNPVVLAVATGAGVTLVTLLLTEGLRRSTAAALAGTFGALLATGVIAAVVTAAARFSVLQGSEDVGFLQGMVGTEIDLSGLLLASVILGALGVLDDVTVTQAVTVDELARSDPSATRGALAARAMGIGRSHIAATMNTLVLAYVAAALPLLLLFTVASQPVAALSSTEVIAVEVVRALVGSIGIVLAVPLTTLVAARLVPRTTEEAGPPADGGGSG